MTFDGDPYRVLGLPHGASLAEVKRAYRLLAKQFHPDSAGERALPRFLAIQAAYESLVTGRTPPIRRPTRSSPAAWEADPTRARATRDAYRRRGAGGPSGASAGRDEARTGGPTKSTGSTKSTGTRPGTNTGGGTAWTRTPPRDGPPGDRSRRRPGRKATLGSTSYDDARSPFEATWEGGTWYGASSGTYWTINPKEYADPRKHGPEYLARARRARRGAANGSTATN
ncbi:MAG TPA: DnaJ domain-containing protein, partial [Candidatus Limnocylindrales bacterium]